MGQRLDWERARERDATRREPKFRAGPAWRYDPATADQIAFLNRLHVKRFGTPYVPPRGLTKAQASDLIDRF